MNSNSGALRGFRRCTPRARSTSRGTRARLGGCTSVSRGARHGLGLGSIFAVAVDIASIDTAVLQAVVQLADRLALNEAVIVAAIVVGLDVGGLAAVFQDIGVVLMFVDSAGDVLDGKLVGERAGGGRGGGGCGGRHFDVEESR